MTVARPACGNCVHWAAVDQYGVQGECRRHPPRVLEDNHNTTFLTLHPDARVDHWCGEHKRRRSKFVTDDFEEHFVDIGSYQIECVCGRVHFGEPGSWDWEEGEYQELQRRAQVNPDAVVYHPGVDTIVSMTLPNHAPAVIGCPCNAAVNFEDWVWNNPQRIMRYLRDRATEEASGGYQSLDAQQRTVCEAILAAEVQNDMDESDDS